MTSHHRAFATVVRIFGAAVVVLATVSCASAKVAVTVPRQTEGVVLDACNALKDSLPKRLHGLRWSPTTPDSPLTAAWSDSTDGVITLRCGLAAPDSGTADILNVDEVDWIPISRDHGTSFITVGRIALVQIDVPISLRPEASYLVPLASAIVGAVPLTN